MASSGKRKRNNQGQQSSSMVVSYGVLLYQRAKPMAKASSSNNIRFLLGLIPQRNWWTVFKGLPDGKESPYETAVREFEEETGTLGLLQNFQPLATLHGRAGKKRLEIFLHEGSFFDPKKHFCSDRVVTIDDGYMQGKPEIVDVRWMTLDEALSGVDGAKIYKSQQNILEEAHAILMKNLADQTNEAAS